MKRFSLKTPSTLNLVAPEGPAQVSSSDDDWSPPPEFDEYRLLRLLGRGRTGRVFLAHDTLLDREVAIKFVPALDGHSLSRFMVEARAAARVQHPNVVTLHRVGQLGGHPYLVTEFIPGQTLEQVEKPLSLERLQAFAVGLARGLAAAHRHGVLHRDIKPGNVLLTGAGEVKLVDFGLAKLLGRPDIPARPAPDWEAVAREAGQGTNLLDAVVSPITHFALIGTPAYMSPEAWRGETVDARSDVYSLGAVLFELGCGAPPHGGIPARALPTTVLSREAPALRERMVPAAAAFAEVVQRCLLIDPLARYPSADAVLDALEFLRLEPHAEGPPSGNPYRGLQAFEAKHRRLFFGRSSATRSAVERLRAESFVVVTGDSGVGKSSLCMAGVLPAIKDGALEDGRVWDVVRCVPTRCPLESLAQALGKNLDLEEQELLGLLKQDARALRRQLRKHLKDRRGLVLFVDQLEELVTLSPREEAVLAAQALAELNGGLEGFRLLATLRSDFLTRLVGLPGLGQQLPRALEFLRAPTPDELREAVTGPARALSVRFESEALVTEVVDAAANADAGLPLLQFALAELWEARDVASQVISGAALRSLGGVEGALTRHADSVLNNLPPRPRVAAQRILTRLITPQGTRARRMGTELVDGSSEDGVALEALVRGRLLALHETESGTTYELAHEALVHSWDMLARWVDRDSERRMLTDRLERAAAEWSRVGHNPEALWGQRHLGEAQALDPGELGPRERAFLQASHRAVRRTRLLRRTLVGGFLLVGMTVWGGLRLKTHLEQRRAVVQALRASADRLAEARAVDLSQQALRAEAFRDFEAKDRPAAEATWKRAVALDLEVERRYGSVAEQLEQALAIGPQQDDVQRALADFLFARAEAAEARGHESLRDMLLQRMRLYDTGGARWQQWNAPAEVQLDSNPSGAEVRVVRATRGVPSEHLGDAQPLGTTPLRQTLEPGSYVLLLSAPGRVTTRLPVLLKRGEHFDQKVLLPLASMVPAGFAYVPQGRFLFGSAEDERVREFFNSAPQHEAVTEGFFVAKAETTFADWISFLEALPERERRQRLPRVSSSGLHGSLRLERDAKSWVLHIQPSRVAFVARAGEKVRYPARALRFEQDWLRFPVSGISYADAKAYAAWLNTSGRVPGARLCTEEEWERSARGADGREFPNGDQLAPDDANFDQTYGKQPLAFGPDEVGSHPASRSLFGVDDASGNVWEWVTSSMAEGEAVARGGSYYFASNSARLTNRELPEPTLRDLTVGMRVCADFVPRSPQHGRQP